MADNVDEILKKYSKPDKPQGGDEIDSILGKYSVAPAVKDGAGMAFLEHYGNTATAGYLPHIQAGVEQLLPDPNADLDAKLAAEGFSVTQPEQSYVASRDANIERLKLQAQQHPDAALAGDITGAIANALITSKILPGASAETASAKIGQAAKVGAITGAVANPGDVKGEISSGQLGERLTNAGIGAGVGAVTQGAFEVGGKIVDKVKNLPSSFREYAEEKAFKSTGAMLRDYRKAYGEERINEIGRVMLDRGLLKPGYSFDDIVEAATKLKATEGENIGAMLKELATIESGKGLQKATREQLGDAVKGDLTQPSSLPGVEDDNQIIGQLVDRFKSAEGGKDLGVTDLQALKEQIGDLINWKRIPGSDVPVKEKFYRSLYDKVKNELENRAESISKDVGLKAYTGSKSAYRAASDIEKISADRSLRESANRFLSPTDYLTGGMGAAAGFASGDDIEGRLKNAAIGGSLALANKAARLYGNPIVAHTADKIGALGQAVKDTMTTMPGVLGPFEAPLKEALEQGVNSYAATLYYFSKDPAFQKQMGIKPESTPDSNLQPIAKQNSLSSPGVAIPASAQPIIRQQIKADASASNIDKAKRLNSLNRFGTIDPTPPKPSVPKINEKRKPSSVQLREDSLDFIKRKKEEAF